MKILTSSEDDFLYKQLLRLLNEIKTVQGGTALSSTLRRHTSLKIYLIEKQIEKIKAIEERYFMDDGSLNSVTIRVDNNKISLQS